MRRHLRRRQRLLVACQHRQLIEQTDAITKSTMRTLGDQLCRCRIDFETFFFGDIL